MSKKTSIEPGVARFLGASLAGCSLALRQAAPHAYYPGWEEDNFTAVTQRVLLASWYGVRNASFEKPRGQKMPKAILETFVLLSGREYKSFKATADAVSAELFDHERHPETALFRELGKMSNEDLEGHAVRMRRVFGEEVIACLTTITQGYVRDLYSAINGAEVYHEAWVRWHDLVAAKLAES